jgi:hypothetical protein
MNNVLDTAEGKLLEPIIRKSKRKQVEFSFYPSKSFIKALLQQSHDSL